MKNKEEYRLVILDTNVVEVFESAADLCKCVVDEKVNQYHVIKTVITHEAYDVTRELAAYKQRQKDKAEAAKTAGQNKPDVEVVIVKGEVKDDPAQKVQGKRPRLSNP